MKVLFTNKAFDTIFNNKAYDEILVQQLFQLISQNDQSAKNSDQADEMNSMSKIYSIKTILAESEEVI